MAFMSLRSASSFFRHSFTVYRLHPLPLFHLSRLQSIPETNNPNNSTVGRYYSHSGRNVYLSNRGYTSPVPHHPQLSLRPFNTTAATRTPETASKQSNEPPSGNARQDSSSSSDDSSDSSDDKSHGEGFDSVDSIRLAVLDASIAFVHEHGWSEKAIAAGAESLGYSGMTHGLVEGGGGELFTHLQRRLNEKLEVELQRLCQQGEDNPDCKLSVSAFVEVALKHRLGLIVPYLPVWSRGLVVAAMSPSTAKQGLHNIATLADHVCHYSGDISFNTDWYTKRAAVALVYKAAELSLLQDNSSDYEDTWKFLQRRVSEVVSLEKQLGSLNDVAVEAARLANAALSTSFNMIGLNSKSR